MENSTRRGTSGGRPTVGHADHHQPPDIQRPESSISTGGAVDDVDQRRRDRTNPAIGHIESVGCSGGIVRVARSAAWLRGVAAISATAMVTAVALSVWPLREAVAATFIVTTFDDDLDPGATCEPHDCTLRAAVEGANDGDDIVLAAGTYRLEAQIELLKAVTIRGQGMNETTITPDVGGHRIFDIPAGATGPIVIEDLRLLDGDGTGASAGGGALRSQDGPALTVRRVRVEGADASGPDGGFGGGIHIHGSSEAFSSVDSEIVGNRSTLGGGIFIGNHSGPVQIVRTTFQDNSVPGLGQAGGALVIASTVGNVTVSNAKFISNHAAGSGGAMSVSGGSGVTVSGSRFDGNEATLLGGALHASDGASIAVSNASFTNNDAGAGSIAGAGDTGTDIALAFVTIRAQTSAFSSSGGAAVTVKHSALETVTGCAELSAVTGSIADVASDADCGDTQVADLGLVTDVAPPDAWPAAASPLVDSATTDCPATDQRGVSRNAPCAVGAIDPVGIACPSGPLPRGELITCSLDVALHGPDVAVHAQHNPVVFDDVVPIANGSGTFTFTLSTTEPSNDLFINVDSGTYSASFPIVAAGVAAGSSSGSQSGGGSEQDGSPNGDQGAPSGAESASSSRAPTPVQLADTGADRRPVVAIGILIFALGAAQLRRVVHASLRAHDAK